MFHFLRKQFHLFVSIFCLVIGIGCSLNNASQEEYIISDYAGSTEVNSEEEVESKSEYSRKLVKIGDVSFEVKDLGSFKQQISASIQQFDGYLSSENSNRAGLRDNLLLTVRIPTQNFDKFFNSITKNIENISNKEVTSKDVTARYYDLQTRIQTKKEIEQRYILLLEKAKNVEEILKVEKELGKLRTAIESMQGQFKLLQNQVGFSTWNITVFQLHEGVTIEEPNRMLEAVSFGWEFLTNIFIGLLSIWPLLIILLLLFLWYYKRRDKK